MSENDKVSFNEGEEEEFHITDEDIDRELAAMEIDHASTNSEENVAAGDQVLAAQPAKKSRFAKLKQLQRKHWLMIISAILLALFALLKMLGNNQSAAFDQITPVATTPVSAVTTMPVNKSETDLAKTTLQPETKPSKVDPLLSAPTLTPPPANKTQLQADLTTLSNNETKLLDTLDTLQQQNTMLRQELATLSNRVQGLESSVNQSSQSADDLSRDVLRMKTSDASSTNVPASPPPAEVSTEPQYTVEAVVPQRAWLQKADGSTVTVMIGDQVPGLGAVVTIDPYSGNVTTSSGAVLKYGN